MGEDSWTDKIRISISELGFSQSYLLAKGYIDRAREEIFRRLHDVDIQTALAAIAGSCSNTIYKSIITFPGKVPPYSTSVTSCELRWLMTQCRLNSLQLMEVKARYRSHHSVKADCPAGCLKAEDMVHFLAECPLYTELRKQYLEPLIVGFNYISFASITLSLLTGTDYCISYRTAKFVKRALEKWKSLAAIKDWT